MTKKDSPLNSLFRGNTQPDEPAPVVPSSDLDNMKSELEAIRRSLGGEFMRIAVTYGVEITGVWRSSNFSGELGDFETKYGVTTTVERKNGRVSITCQVTTED